MMQYLNMKKIIYISQEKHIKTNCYCSQDILLLLVLLRSTQKSSISRDQQSCKKIRYFYNFFPLELESTKQFLAAVRKYHVSDTFLKIAVVEKVGITIMCICPFQEVMVSSSYHFHVLQILPFLLIIEKNQTCKTIIVIEMIDVLQFFKIKALLNRFEG